MNLGSEKGIFEGLRYNIFEDERELISRASIHEVREGFSKAIIIEKENCEKVRERYFVRTR